METVIIPAAIERALRLPQLQPEQFVPTKWDDRETKAKFGNHLLRFIAVDCPETMFKQTFYQRLSNTFSFIAHYDRPGFFNEYFTTRHSKITFLEYLARHPCWGDPAYTYSDLERVVRLRIRRSGIIDLHRGLLAQEIARAERAEYDRLRRKFGDGQTAIADHEISPAAAASAAPSLMSPAAPCTPASVTEPQPRQADLFALL